MRYASDIRIFSDAKVCSRSHRRRISHCTSSPTFGHQERHRHREHPGLRVGEPTPGSPPSPARSRRGSRRTPPAGHPRSARTAPARRRDQPSKVYWSIRVVQFSSMLFELGQDRRDVVDLLVVPLGEHLLQALRPVPHAGFQGLGQRLRGACATASSRIFFTASDGSSSVAAARASCTSTDVHPGEPPLAEQPARRDDLLVQPWLSRRRSPRAGRGRPSPGPQHESGTTRAVTRCSFFLPSVDQTSARSSRRLICTSRWFRWARTTSSRPFGKVVVEDERADLSV